PGESGLAEMRRQAQAKVDEAERLRRRTADLDALRRLDHDSRTLTDTTQIRDLGDKVRAIAKTYAGEPEVEAAAGRMLDVLAQMQDASALLSRRDFAGLQKTCERLCAQYPQHVLFQRLESEAARGLRQAAVQELRHKLQT